MLLFMISQAQKNLYPRVWQLAWPMILANISIPLLGMVDTALVGHWALAEDMAAVALGSMVFDIIFWAFGFLRMSTTAISAQKQASCKIFYQSSLIAAILSVLLLIFSPWLKALILLFIHSTPSVEEKLSAYFDIRIFSGLFTLTNYVIFGFFFGKQNTRIPLILLCLTNALAMLLDVYFVAFLNYGAKGIALANLIAQVAGMSLGILLTYHQFLSKQAIPSLHQLLSKQELTALFRLNSDIFIRTLMLVATTAFFTRQSASLGVVVIAANSILMQMQLLVSYALDGFAIAAESLIGQAIGENNKADFLSALKACTVWIFMVSIIFMLFYALFGEFFIQFMSAIPEIQQFAKQFLIWVILLPLISAPGFLLDGVFIGAAWSDSLRNTMLFSSLVVFFPLWYVTKSFGNYGLWMAYSGFMLARGLSLLLSLYQRCKQWE